MSLIEILKRFSTIIFVILALMLSRLGIGYLTLLILLGLIVSFINKRKRDAIIAGLLYAMVGYILSYPTGLLLADYMPTTDIVIETNAATMMTDLVIGALIPMIVAFVICGITAIIGSNIAKYLESNKKSTTEFDNTDTHQFNVVGNFKQKQEKQKETRKNKEELINLTPIQKAKMRKEKENDGD